jgi:hypothetical protein
MATFTALSRGTQIILVAGPLLFASLFFTWQNVEIDYGPRGGTATFPLDGFDAWGLLLAILVLCTVTIVSIRSFTELEMSDEVAWETVTLGLGVATAAVAVLKSLTDTGSSWESYGFVGLGIAVAAGAYLDWAASRRERRPYLMQKRRGIRPAA